MNQILSHLPLLLENRTPNPGVVNAYKPTSRAFSGIASSVGISEFEDGEWSRQSSGGSIETITNDFISGNTSLKMTTPGTASGAVFADKTLSLPDIRTIVFRVAVKSSDSSLISGIWADLGDSTLDNYYRLDVVKDLRQLRDGEWTFITFTTADIRSQGGTPPAWGAIQKMRLRVNTTVGVVSVLFDKLQYYVATKEPRVSIVFDDGYVSDYTVAKPIMDKYGFSGVSYVIQDKVGTSNRATIDQLKQLEKYSGWDIAAHASPDLTTLDDTRLHGEFINIKDFLISNGFTKAADHFALPMGRYNKKVIDTAAKYFSTVRTINTQTETIIPGDPLKLRVFYCTSTTTLSQLNAALAANKRNGCWTILVFHRIVATTSEPEDVSTANFTSFMAAVNTNAVPVVTLSGLAAGM